MAQNRWQFIDSSKDSADNLTQVKRHVMQEYMRQKRMETTQQERTDGNDQKTSTPTAKGTSKRYQSRAKKTKESNANTPTAREGGGGGGGGGARLRVVPAVQGIDQQNHQSSHNNQSSSVSPHLDKHVDGSTHGVHLNAGVVPLPTRSARLSPPRTVLSAARTDPFNTLPWQTTREDQHLFDFYVNEMPACSYGHHYRSKRAHNWYTEVFVPEAMKGPLTFVNTILVHAANTWAWVRNETETNSTLRYRQLGISMLLDHIQNFPHDITDNVITACMSAAALEDFDPRPGHTEISWIHMRQAQKLIRRRGGPAAFENTTLARLINWQDYIFAGYISDPDSFYFDEDYRFSDSTSSTTKGSLTAELPSPPNSTSPFTSNRTPSPIRHPLNITAEQEIAFQCEEFLNFLARCESLSVSQRTTPLPNSAPSRHSAFGPGSILYRILISPAEKRKTVTGDRKQFIARLAALMMLNAAIWDYRLSISKTEAFLGHVIRQLRNSEVTSGSSIEALLQILLACKDFPSDKSVPPMLDPVSLSQAASEGADFSQYSESVTSPFGRPWFVGRMLKVAKRIGLQSWLRLNRFLFDCLTLQVQESGILSWGPQLRNEILRAPLTSYTMPALQEAVFLAV